MLRIENLSRAFGSIRAVQGISAVFRKGSLTILAGEDGSGKSTLLKMLLGLVKPDSGEIYLNEMAVGSDFKCITRITGYMPERFSLYTDLTVEENMNFFADIQGASRRRREALKKELLEKTGMWEFRRRRAGALSGGMKQKLALSSILVSSPEIIILDEPTTGVDPLSRIEFFRIIDDLKKEGRTIIASTPYLDEAERGDEVLFFKAGSIIQRGPIQKLKRNFPAKILRYRPDKPVFDFIDAIRAEPEFRSRVFIRGRFIKLIHEEGLEIPSIIPLSEVEEVAPTLEDIFYYYARMRHAG